MKKLVIIATAFLLALFAVAPCSSLAKGKKAKSKPKEIKLLVVAYYKPLPKQKEYATGSYWGDLRRNGRTGKTFSEKEVEKGHAAADLTILPLGTVIKVPEHGVVKVEDTGGGVKGNKIDIFMGKGDEGLKRAIEWGQRSMKVEIVKWGG